MEETEECPPVTVEGDWTPSQTRTAKNKLQIYFNSKKKSSGGDCRVEVEDGAPKAAVYFRSEEVRERVLARQDHKILLGEKPVKLRLSSAPCPTNGGDVSDPSADSKTTKSEVKPEDGASAEKENEPVQSLSVVLDNVEDTMSRDLLMMLVETISGLDESHFSLEIIMESDRAVVTFKSPEGVEKFLSVSQSSQKLQKYKLTARQLEAAKSVRVESPSSKMIKDMLEMYFEKNWTIPESVTMIPEDEAAIVTFSDPKVVESICTKRDYSIGSTPVKVYPYYESLSTALYGKERPTWKMPEPITETVLSVIWKFLEKKKLFDSINAQMRQFHCSVNMDKPEVKLSPVPNYLRQKGLTAQQVEAWSSTALDGFRRLMSQYTAFECPANKRAWTAAEEEVCSVVREDAVLVLDESKGVLTVAGRADIIKKVRSPVENIVLRAVRQCERQTNGVSEMLVLSPAMHYILHQEGLQKAAQDISPDMNLSYDNGTQKLTISGLKEEVSQMKTWILEMKMKTYPSADSKTPKSEVKPEDGASAEKENEPVQSLSVVLDNVEDTMSRDLLMMLVETISGLDESHFSLEIIMESDRAVVTFKSPEGVEKFLSVSQSSQKLQKYKLTARQLEAAKSVRVESPSSKMIKDMLEMYFEKNWTVPESVTMIPEEEAAIVTFSDPKVVESICTKRDYSIGSTPVKVYPYYESLSTALYGKERPTWKMPEPITEIVLSVVWKFLEKKKLFDSINAQMRQFHCSVNMDKPEVKLSPVPNYLRQKGLTAQQVEAWSSTTLDGFRRLMSQYTAFECPANKRAWTAAEEEVRSVVREDAVLVLDESKGVLTVAGRADIIKKVRSPVENIVLRAVRQCERQTNGVSEMLVLSPAIHYILHQERLQKAAQDISPDMNLSYDNGTQKLTISGLKEEVSQMKSWILEMNMKMCKKQINIHQSLLVFLKTVDPMFMSQHLFTSQHICAIFSVDSQSVLLVGSSEHALTAAENKMKENLKVQTLDVEDQEVLKHQNWADLNRELLDSYNSSKGKTVSIQIPPGSRDKVTVVGLATPVKEICRSLGEYISNYSQIQDNLPVKSCAVIQFIDKKKPKECSSIAKNNNVNVSLNPLRRRIIITGARLHVQKAKSCFKELTDSLLSDNFSVNKPWAKKYFQSQGSLILSNKMSGLNCVVMLCPENEEEEEEEKEEEEEEESFEEEEAGGQRPQAAGPGRMEQITAEGLKIFLCQGNIQDQNTHVIVNTIAENMNLKQGAVSNAILQAAGPGLQAAVRSEAGVATLQYGEVVITDGFKLMCQKVFHVVCPVWDNNSGLAEEALITVIRKCLMNAEKLKMASLSFPAIGTGNLGFPRDVVSRVLLKAIQSFRSQRTPQHLREVVIVVHPSDTLTVDCFTRDFKGHCDQRNVPQAPAIQPPNQSANQSQRTSASFGQVKSPSLGVYQMQMGPLSLEVSSGDITKETCDVIINSSNQTFDLRTGVSKAILDSAGPSVQLECSQIVSSPGYQSRPLIITSAGQLPSRNIIHVIGRNDPQQIKEIVYYVLKVCEENKFKSVAFPALGTGQVGVNPVLVADAMVDGIVDFLRKKQPKSVCSVKILIFQAVMMTEFHKSMKKREGEAVEEKSIFTRIKDSVQSLFSGFSEEPSRRENLVLETEEFGLTEFQLCADNKMALSQAKKRIEEMIVAEQTKKTITNPYIRQLSQEDMDELKDLQRSLTVSIRLEEGQEDEEPTIHLEGLTRDVFNAESSIRDIIRKVERNELLKGRALLVSSLVEWQFQSANGKMESFDIYTNLKLEEALDKTDNVKIKIKNQTYNADVKFKRAVSVGGGKMLELLRKDLNDGAALPSHWDDMKGALLKLIPLKAGSTEYNDVKTELTRTTLTPNIVSIERVQNPTLWQSYQLKKTKLERKNKHKNNERRLFHGAGADSIDLINKHGFNRSYGGRHAAMFGNGTYFAVDSRYSAQGYSPPDAKGHRRMYLARVLVGNYTWGARGLLAPPVKGSGYTSDLYDSVTDHSNPPTMFIVFNDALAYPEYLITFT